MAIFCELILLLLVYLGAIARLKAPVLITFCLHDILSSAEERYKKASSFTRKLNLFDKDFIFIPVCRRCVRESCLFYRIYFI